MYSFMLMFPDACAGYTVADACATGQLYPVKSVSGFVLTLPKVRLTALAGDCKWDYFSAVLDDGHMPDTGVALEKSVQGTEKIPLLPKHLLFQMRVMMRLMRMPCCLPY